MTKIINREMSSGKTTTLVRMMFEPGNEDVVYVAPTIAQAKKIALRVAVDLLGYSETPELSNRFIGVSELHRRGGLTERYVVDEVDEVLRILLGCDIVAIAGTDEDHKIAYKVKRGF